MTALDNASTEVTVRYRCQENWHLFTSDQLDGLFVASQDLEEAFNDVPEAIQALLRLDHGFECIAQPKLTYEDFIRLKVLRDDAHESVARRTEEFMEVMRTPGDGVFLFMVGSPFAEHHVA